MDEVVNIVKKFPTNQLPKLEIIREKSKKIVKNSINKNKRTSFKNRFSDLIKQFICENKNCPSTVAVFRRGPKIRNKKHRHLFVLNPEN